jgi:hypothetical protein
MDVFGFLFLSIEPVMLRTDSHDFPIMHCTLYFTRRMAADLVSRRTFLQVKLYEVGLTRIRAGLCVILDGVVT